jgi:hypothetical protein
MSSTLANFLGIGALLCLYGFAGTLDRQDEEAFQQRDSAGAPDPGCRAVRLVCTPEVTRGAHARRESAGGVGLIAMAQPDADPAEAWTLRCVLAEQPTDPQADCQRQEAPND